MTKEYEYVGDSAEEQTPTAEELLARNNVGGASVVNCVLHMGLDITRRPDDCPLCLSDLRNAFSRAVRVNEWLNDWRDDALAVLSALDDEAA